MKRGPLARFMALNMPLCGRLGEGKRLFRKGVGTTTMRLVSSKPTTKGVLILTYEPGDVAGSGEKAAIPVEQGWPTTTG